MISEDNDKCPKVVNSREDCNYLSLSELSELQRRVVWIAMEGVFIFRVALRISLILGTPKVTFFEEIPAAWKVFRVI